MLSITGLPTNAELTASLEVMAREQSNSGLGELDTDVGGHGAEHDPEVPSQNTDGAVGLDVQFQYGKAKSGFPLYLRQIRSKYRRYARCQGRKYQFPWGQ